MKKQIFGILFALCTVLCLVPARVFAEGETTKEVETEQELADALADSTVDVITLKSNIQVSTTLNVERTVTLDIYGYMLEMSGNGGAFVVKSGGHLTLKDSDIISTYRFTPDAEALWKRDTSGTEIVTGGVIYGGNAQKGGGVYVEKGGRFTMNGGTIRDCKALYGSEIFYTSGDLLTLNGTIISDNSFGEQPVYVQYAYGVSVIIGAAADIQANVYLSACTVRANGGTVRGDVYANWEITLSVDEGVTHGTIFYGKLTGGCEYKVDGFTVTYKVDSEDYATQFLRSGETALTPNDPTKDGYLFIGWYNGETVYNFNDPVTGDITLTGKQAKLCDKMADFTADDGGAEAIALLNSAKTGETDSTWDNDTKTLTLKGVSFAATVTTAVKLPDGATVILADGTENRIIGGGATVSQDGGNTNKIYSYGIYAAGTLTVQGETEGTGKLYVNSGDHINSGDAWTYSIALCMNGDLTIKSGYLTAQGGKATCADGGFSYGIWFAPKCKSVHYGRYAHRWRRRVP